MKYLISFGTSEYLNGQKRLNTSAEPYFEQILSYNESSLKDDFYTRHSRLFADGRGFGYWIWKPHLIFETLREINFGDFVCYCDTLIEFIADPSPLFDLCAANNGFFICDQQHKQSTYTKRDTFVITGTDFPVFHKNLHANAAFQIYQKNSDTLDFVRRWLTFCSDYQCVSDSPNIYGANLPDFKAHRHDQSILGLLAQKYNIRTYNSVCQYGAEWAKTNSGKDSPFGQIINHHRAK